MVANYKTKLKEEQNRKKEQEVDGVPLQFFITDLRFP